ncbi:MAG: homoserine kinase [Alphaproteobacteria bacterium]|nr:homoserine kinase [Alphaproteobacteria bacterium]
MAVFTPVSAHELQHWLTAYDVGDYVDHIAIAEGVENTNYHLITSRGTYVLTLFEKRVNVADLPFFMGIMNHLAGQNFPCPQPLPHADGGLFGTLKGKGACLVTFLPGAWTRHIQPLHVQQVGKILATMHGLGKNFQQTRANTLSLAGWPTLWAACRPRADDVHEGLVKEVDDELDFLQRHWPHNLPTGFIHADLFQDNVLFENDMLTGVIDFYFGCTDFLAYDLAITLNAWCVDARGTLNPTMIAAMMDAYEQVRPLGIDEKKALPIFLRGCRKKLIVKTRQQKPNAAPGAMVTEKNPLEYFWKLRTWQQPR